MPSITVNSLLKTYPQDKLDQNRKYVRYSNVLDRMFYEMTYYNKYSLLGVTQIEGTTEIDMDLLRDTVKKAINIFCNSKIPNILSKINDEYRSLRRMIITVNFDIDDYIESNIIQSEINQCNYLNPIFDVLTSCCTDTHTNADENQPMMKRSPTVKNLCVYDSFNDKLYIQK